ncbi:MAG: RNA polymerase sigma factor [Thermomicrobiales bacterium]
MRQDVRKNIATEPEETRAPAGSPCPPVCATDGVIPDGVVPDEDREIARAKSDPVAFAPLYERYADAIYGYCYRRTSDREQAADLTSQIFVKALVALERFDPQVGRAPFRSWLFSIAHNHVVDAHRLRRQHASLDNDARPMQIADTSPTPEDHAIANERRRDLTLAMAELTDGQRQIVELRLAGLTGPEIATVLGMQLPAVKSSQFRAYTRLRQLLRQIDLMEDADGKNPGSSSTMQEASDA